MLPILKRHSDKECLICSSRDIFEFYDIPRLKRKVYRCSRCKFTWVIPPILYENDTNIEHYKSPSYSEYLNPADDTNARIHFKNISAAINLNSVPSKSILEIGCAYGHLLRKFASSGHEVEGLELLEDAVNYCFNNGIKIYNSSIEEFVSHKKYGIIISTHVVEHLTDIDSYIKKTNSMLESGGLNIIVTPNGNSLFFRILHKYWTYSTPDEHNAFLTPESVRVLAERHNSNIWVIKNTGRFCGLSRGILRELYKNYRFSSIQQENNSDYKARKSVPPSNMKRDKLEKIYRLISVIESPFLKLTHKLLVPSLRSDELLIVLRKN